MCGIVGFYNLNVSIERLLAMQTYRGPDAVGSCSIDLVDGLKLQLGHNRLKIICLTETANQPFVDESKQHYLTFNGEIYNYRELKTQLQQEGVQFHTESDTEVLLLALKHWGMAAVSKLNGMFAFAYFDRKAQKLYLVRDRFGVKPLYYFSDEQRLLFASTSAPIVECCALKPNFIYVKRGLQYGIYEDDSNVTAYQDLCSVPAGHFLEFSLSHGCQPKVINYYHLQSRVYDLKESIKALSESQLLEKVGELLYDANHLRLNADVPIAVAMSGGLDSGAIAAISKQQFSDVEGFCFGNPDDGLSEGPLAAHVSRLHNIKLHFVHPEQNEWSDAFWQALHFQDAPFPSLSIVAQYLLYKKIKQAGFKVVLGGQGGDEAFLGYRKFQLFYMRELVAQQNWLTAARFFYGFTQMLWAEKARMLAFWQMRERYSQPFGTKSVIVLPGDAVSLNMGYSGNIQERQMADILQFSLPTLLRYEDRNSMAHSIESRLPFMDYRLIELACALPIKMKIKNGFGKWALRQLMKNKLPDNIRLVRYKRGFDVAQNNVILKALGHTILDRLHDQQHLLQQVVDGDVYNYFNPTNLGSSSRRFSELVALSWLVNKM